jgi:phosphate transport system substrate-binding protein
MKKRKIFMGFGFSGTREVFWEKGLSKNELSPKANVVVSNGAMKTAIAQEPAGVGYVSVGHIQFRMASLRAAVSR